MPRQVEETLLKVRWAMRKVEVPAHAEDGMPLYPGTGEPRMETQWILDLVDESPFERRILHVPFNKDSRDKLVQALTGGIVPASELPNGRVEI